MADIKRWKCDKCGAEYGEGGGYRQYFKVDRCMNGAPSSEDIQESADLCYKCVRLFVAYTLKLLKHTSGYYEMSKLLAGWCKAT